MSFSPKLLPTTEKRPRFPLQSFFRKLRQAQSRRPVQPGDEHDQDRFWQARCPWRGFCAGGLGRCGAGARRRELVRRDRRARRGGGRKQLPVLFLPRAGAGVLRAPAGVLRAAAPGVLRASGGVFAAARLLLPRPWAPPPPP